MALLTFAEGQVQKKWPQTVFGIRKSCTTGLNDKNEENKKHVQI